jgi:hypothetical protein
LKLHFLGNQIVGKEIRGKDDGSPIFLPSFFLFSFVFPSINLRTIAESLINHGQNITNTARQFPSIFSRVFLKVEVRKEEKEF